MELLTNLTNLSPQEWDEHIKRELEAATIKVRKFRDYDSPHFSVKHTLNGYLGQWKFSRDPNIYAFWGDVPLATAEVIARDPDCAVGCMPKQWFSNWGEKVNPGAVHAQFADHIVYMDDRRQWVKDENFSDGYKASLQHDDTMKLIFVDNPSAFGKPYIRTYTFFTEAALRAFVAIVRRHRIDYIMR